MSVSDDFLSIFCPLCMIRMENSDNHAVNTPSMTANSNSTAKGIIGLDETMQMPTTAQLMEVMRHINPFDQKFREANEAMQAAEFSQILGSLSSSSSMADLGGTYNDPMLASISDTTLSALRAASTSKSPGNELRLKLPDAAINALTGVCSLLNADDSGGCGLDTPDIANLMTQMKEESSYSKAAPLTADVLKTVLEIRETLDLQKAKKLSGRLDDQLDSTEARLQYQENMQEVSTDVSGKTPPGVGLDQQHDIGPCDSLLTTDLDTHRLSSSPPAIPVHENAAPPGVMILNSIGGQMLAVGQQHLAMSSAPTASTQSSLPISQSRNGDDVIIALKIGDQAVQIPVKINVSAMSNDYSNTFMTVSSSARRKTPTGRKGALPTVAPKPESIASAPVMAASTHNQAIGGQSIQYSASAFGQASYDSKQDNSMSKTSDDGNDEEYHKREVLERNKQAACRYRKRKKEEMGTLQDKLKKTETEKLELSTQVQVLRMEIERLRNLLDLHKDCPVSKEQQKRRRIDILTFEHHAPLFHSLVSSNGLQANEDSRSNTPAEQEDGSCTGLLTKSSELSGPTTIRVSTVSKKPTAMVSSSSLLFSQPAMISSGAGGQFVQYLTLSSPNQSAQMRDDGEMASGQQKYILQPVIMPGTPTMVIPGTSSPLIFPTLVKMNSATPASTSAAFMNSGN